MDNLDNKLKSTLNENEMISNQENDEYNFMERDNQEQEAAD